MRLVFLLSVLSSLCACGGIVVFEEPGAGGGAATSSSSTTNASSTSISSTSVGQSSSTGVGPCDSHEDCAPGVCLFASGVCAPACAGDFCESCGPGLFCEPCATGSCPGCADCVGACLPIQPGRCDDDDPCPDGAACLFSQGTCAPRCGPMGECSDFEFCEFCATGSCCGCEDCVSVCLGGE